jgi:ferredoxin
MRLTLDTDRCEGHALCVARAPELFDVDDEGHSIPLVDEVTEDQIAAARKAVNACPERAISLHDN